LLPLRISCAAAVLALAAPCQEPVTFRVGTDLVTVPVTVTDHHGVALQNLKVEDFHLFDEGKRMEIQHLWRDADLPLTVGILVDVSYSETNMIPKEREAVVQFLNRIMRKDDRAFLATTATHNFLVTDLTASIEALQKGSRLIDMEHRLRNPGQPLGEPCPTKVVNDRIVSRCGGSAIWDAVYAAAELKLKPLQGTKALIIISDGQDTGSMHKLEPTVEEMQISSTIVYAIKVGDLRTILTHGLAKLSSETGGEQFKPSGGNFTEIFQKIEDDLRTRYVLGFRPEGGKPGPHQLKVETTRKGVEVRARMSYYQGGGG
jgi:VWFA-related protein